MRVKWIPIILIAGGGLLALVGVVAAIGAMLPVQHRAVGESEYAVPRDSLYTILTDVERYPAWRSGMTRVVRREPLEGKERWLEVTGDGEILYERLEALPDRRIVTRIADPALPFGGRWTLELEDGEGGTRLRITEDGEVYNPIFRFVSKYIFGHDATIETFLADLRARTTGTSK